MMPLPPVHTNELGDDRMISIFRMLSGRPKPARWMRVPKPARIAIRHAGAWATGECSYTQIAAYFVVHFTTVERVIRRAVQMSECSDARPDFFHAMSAISMPAIDGRAR